MIGIKTDWQLQRRQLLKGLGIGAACLPLLQASKSFAQATPFPTRLISVLLTEGYQVGQFAPPTGPIGTLPTVTAPLENHKGDIIILGNLNNPQFRGCARWAHGTYGTVFAQDRGDPNTGNGKEYWEPMGPTFDQVAAKELSKGGGVVVPSIALSVRVGTNSGGTGSNRCHWAGAKQPITPEADPYKMFSTLFTGRPSGMPDPAADKLRAERKSLLDFVGGQLERFANQLGTQDRDAIKGHMQSIRTLENELTMARGSVASCGDVKPTGDAAKPVPIGDNASNPALLTVGFQLMTAALKCGATRVATLQFGDATGGSVTFPVVGVGANWHSLGHSPGNNKIKVDVWCMEMFAKLLDELKAVPEGTGQTMLDHMTVLWANHMEAGNTHGSFKLPWIVAGKANGFWRTGHSHQNEKNLNNTHVMTEILNSLGIPTQQFGDGGRWPELVAKA